MKLSIVIPAHNEEQRLPPVLRGYAVHFSGLLGDGFEIVVVVNGTTDRTAEVAREIAKDFPQIKVLDDPRKIGKGGAVSRWWLSGSLETTCPGSTRRPSTVRAT